MTRPVRLGLGVWAVLAVAVSARVLVQKPGRASVVPIYLKAGEAWRAGGDLYAPTGLDVYRYPPGFAAAFAPLTFLPGKVVAVGWRLLGAAVKPFWSHSRASGVRPCDARFFASRATASMSPGCLASQVS